MEFAYQSLPYRVLFGTGFARTRLAEEVEALGLSRIMLIAAEAEAGLADELQRPIADRVAVRYSNVRPHVPDEVAQDARRVAAEHEVDGLLSIGGGSTTGTAKMVALSTGLPILAVPTTFAGSEMTPVWGLTTAARKETGVDPRVQPKSVVYDPELVATLPPELTVASALNAMAHCVEAYWTPKANPVISAIATEGVRALSGGLRALHAGTEAADTAREQVLYGAFLAGMSFAAAGSGLHHKICHALGGAFDLPHAQTHAVVLPHVLAFNAPAVPAVAQRIAEALGAQDAVQGLLGLNREIGAPRGLRELGLSEQQLDEAVGIVGEKLPIENPRPVGPEDIATILRGAYG